MAVFLTRPAPAAAVEERQHMVEAAFLNNFFNFITWPGHAGTEIGKATICVVGDDPIEPYLGYVQKKIAEKRVLTIRKVEDVKSLNGCHILFTRQSSPELFHAAAASGILSVFAPDNDTEEGGMIQLLKVGDKLKVRVFQNELATGGFKVSARLLELAEKRP